MVVALATIVAAYVFRSQRARGMLGVLLRIAYVYIAVVFVLAAFRLWQMAM